MQKLKLGMTMATVALLSGVFVAPASADNQFTVSGNGSRSDNSISADFQKNVSIRQSNDTMISNTVRVSNSTGGNVAGGNTGGDVVVATGTTHAGVMIHNQAGSNALLLGACDSCAENMKVTVTGNGRRSDNQIDLSVRHDTSIGQYNDTAIGNNVSVSNTTGDNSANGNTGPSNHNDDWDRPTFAEWCKEHYPHHKGDKRALMKEYKEYKKSHMDQHGNGGDTSIATGDAHAEVEIHNMGSTNELSL